MIQPLSPSSPPVWSEEDVIRQDCEDGGNQRPGQKIAFCVLALIITSGALWTLGSFMPALAWAAVFAIATWPLYRRARNAWPGGGRVLLPLLFTVAVTLLFLGPLTLAGIEVANDARGVIDGVEHVLHNGLPVPSALSSLPFGSPVVEWWQDNLGSGEGAARLARHIDRSQLVAISRHLSAVLAHRVVLFSFMLVTLFFLYRDGDTLTAQLSRASARAFGPHGARVGRQVIASIHGTVDGLVLVGLAEGILIGIGYAIAGVPHPTLFGAVTAIAAMIPFGAPAAFLLAALLLAANGALLSAAIIAGYGCLIVFIADHFVRPFLIGGATRLPFILVLLGILGGVECWGLFGLFLGPALMAAVTHLWREFSAAGPDNRDRQGITEDAP
ncbi:AI-2E family transporter [Granulibacter bethesdensis]|uniref:AI-2E family transporter n=1 Tax=Granulibacter bethesdensis TaxID=364410 RepID=UPI00090AB7CE|nr:AI-2E family transporter [Granulibacter bethesdensis]APH58715.1 putative membrane spanning protein [Granulibacter bethesdensis]